MNPSIENRRQASGLWVGDSLPLLAELSLRSHVANGIDFQLFTYCRYDNVPEGVRVRDAREILPAECIFTHKNGSMAPFSDWFRYAWMSREGGFWCDLDVICLTPNMPDTFPWFAEENPGVIGTAAFGFPAEHPLIINLRELAQDPASPMPWDSEETLAAKARFLREMSDVRDRRREAAWGIAGPGAFSRAIAHYGLTGKTAPGLSVYPLPYMRWTDFYDGSVSLGQFDRENTWGLHLWSEMLRRYPGLLERLHPESVITQLMEKYGMRPAQRGNTERKKVRILVGICSAHGYYERRRAVRETWLKHSQEGVECLFFLGGDVPEREREDTIGLDAPDSYACLPAKVLAFFRYALEHYEFDWLFKCDEDTYLDLSRLPELADPQYGIVGDALLKRRGAPSGGAGYLLKREIVEKIAAGRDVPPTGAEDLIFGKLALEAGAVPHSTPRLYMSNTHYPARDNDMVSAHWCSPELMHALELLRHRKPDTVCHAEHKHWKDELFFYKEGIFRRRSTPCYGWWSVAADGILTLRWKSWGEEQLIRNGRSFSGASLEMEIPEEGRDSSSGGTVFDFCGDGADKKKAAILADEPDRMERLHLGCGSRLLPGWLNLDLPRYDITRPLPWKDGSVKFYYLEHVAEYISPTALYRFLREVWRTLRPDGALRVAVTDRVRHAAGVSLNYEPFRRQQTGVDGGPGWELEALTGHDGVQSFWTQESLSLFLKLAGFEVSVHEPGQSDDPDFQGLERKEAPPEDPFLLLGTVCLEARKPRGVPLLPCLSLKATDSRSLNSAGHNPENEWYVSPFFCSGSRTGNRLFQIAAAYAHALRHGLECRVPWRSEPQSSRLYELLGPHAAVCPDGGYSDPVTYNEPRFSYSPIPGKIRQGRLNGYFQSDKYFDDFSAEIRALYARLKAPRRVGEAGVHVRMGDYLAKSHQFRSPDAGFLEKALERLSKHIRVLHVFSDNPLQALQLVRGLPAGRRFELVLNEEDTLGALRSMSGMQELVMSCSSYSWWGAYLGEPEQVIVQKDWFAGVISDYRDVYRDQWTKL